MVNKRLLVLCVLISLVLGHGLAHAARNFAYVQSPAAASAVFSMGTTQSLSYLISNNNTGTNVVNQVGGAVTLYSDGGVTPGGGGNLDLNYAGELRRQGFEVDYTNSLADITWDRIQMHVNGWGGHFVDPDDPGRGPRCRALDAVPELRMTRTAGRDS